MREEDIRERGEQVRVEDIRERERGGGEQVRVGDRGRESRRYQREEEESK